MTRMEVKGTPRNLPQKAREIVYLHLLEHTTVDDDKDWLVLSIEDVYVVWFAYILGSWKALVSTIYQDGRYYEVTYNGRSDEVYIDTYVKESNLAVERAGFHYGLF